MCRIFVAGPHLSRVRFIIPYRVAEVGIQEDVGLVPVAGHALRGLDGAGEGVGDRMPRFAARRIVGVRRVDQRAMTHAREGAFARGRRELGSASWMARVCKSV